jgi:hypothetical protein
MHEITTLQINVIMKITRFIVLYSERSQNGTIKFYTWATERGLMDGVDGDGQGFLLSVYCCISPPPHLFGLCQPAHSTSH